MPTCTIKMDDCKSDRVACFGYDQATQTLAAMYKQKSGTARSKPYGYPVPPDVYQGLLDAPSVGKYFGNVILVKNEDGSLKYPHTKFEETDDERAAMKQAEGQPA